MQIAHTVAFLERYWTTKDTIWQEKNTKKICKKLKSTGIDHQNKIQKKLISGGQTAAHDKCVLLLFCSQ